MSIQKFVPPMVVGLALVASTRSYAADEKLEEVTVTALAFRSNVDDAIQPVSVLSGDELSQQLSSSIGETLAKQPGITATYFGPNASRPVIRGLSGERVQMLEDSSSALDVSSLSEDHAVSIEDSLASQIEIVKGPASLLYGSGAVGGVINVLTNRIPEKAPKQAISGFTEVRGDEALHERAGVTALELGNDRVAVHLDGYERSTGDVSIPGAAFTPAATAAALAADPNAFIPYGRIYNSASDSKGGSAGVSLLGEHGFIGASVSGFDTFYGVPLSPGENPIDGGSHIDMKQTRYDLKGELDIDNGWLQAVHLRAAHNDYQHAELEADGSVGTQFKQQGDEARVTIDHQLGELRGNVGVQYRSLDFSALGDERFVPPSTTHNTGVFAFEQYAMEPFTLEAGLRLEQQRIEAAPDANLPSYDKQAVSASLGGLWKFAETQSLAMNLTRSQRHPSATELYADGVHDATAQYIIGDPGLKQETANTVDLIWRGGTTVHWHASTYLNQFDNYIYLQPTGDVADGLPVFNYQQSKARYVGAEASVNWHVFEHDARHLDVTLTSDYVRATLQDGDPVPLIPPLRVGIEAEYQQQHWSGTVSVFHYNAQDRIAENEISTDGYTMVDASLRYRLNVASNAAELFLRGSNLTDVDARRHTSPLKEYAPLPGRSLQLGVRMSY